MDKNTEIIFNLFLMKIRDEFFYWNHLYPDSLEAYENFLSTSGFKMLKDCFPENEKIGNILAGYLTIYERDCVYNYIEK
jgi:hypothetical protein